MRTVEPVFPGLAGGAVGLGVGCGLGLFGAGALVGSGTGADDGTGTGTGTTTTGIGVVLPPPPFVGDVGDPGISSVMVWQLTSARPATTARNARFGLVMANPLATDREMT
jgi:hypothetical protein